MLRTETRILKIKLAITDILRIQSYAHFSSTTFHRAAALYAFTIEGKCSIIKGEEIKAVERTVQRICLISDNLCYGPCPAEDDEITQRLTIRRDGRIFLTVCNYRDAELYRQWLRCSPVRAGNLLDKIAGYFSKEKDFLISCTDVGTWTLQVFYSDGSKEEYSCSLHGGYNALTGDVRRLVGIPSLFGFSGENDRAITLMEACKKALEFFGQEYIVSILDVKRGYVIMPISKEWGVPCESPCIVDKGSGAVDVFFPPARRHPNLNYLR